MALELSSVKFIGPALPEPFVKFDLEKILNQNGLLHKTTGEEGKKLQALWDTYRRKLRNLGSSGGAVRVRNHVIDPLVEVLGYTSAEDAGAVVTREGDEDGGFILKTADSATKLRIWTVQTGTDLEAPTRRGYAYRYSHVRIAQRVLLTAQERLGIVTDGMELRILISDAARPDSQVVITINPNWTRSRDVPDTFRFLIAIASPKGLATLPEIIDKARLKQSTVTKELRVQARKAIEGFVQEILDAPENNEVLGGHADKTKLAKDLWHEGLITVYRLLFVLKGEASDDPARSFKFTSSSIWRNTYSPTVKLADFVRHSIDHGADTGRFLETGLKTIFRMFAEGVSSRELNIAPLGGALFGEDSTPILAKLHWPERGCAILLDKLLWTMTDRRGGGDSRQRIHYGSLDIEDLGRVYEALLELDSGIATEKMCRLRRAKLEVVVPYAQGTKYQTVTTFADAAVEEEEDETEEEENPKSKKVLWIEEINPGQFFLRVGLGRKSTGSYYTPHSFVRFLVQETLGPKIEEVSSKDDPYPNNILKLKVLDPAMGSGHFLVEACRFMGDKLYEACRLCDEKAMELEKKAEKETVEEKKVEHFKSARAWRNRIIEIPDPNDEMLQYLPSTAPEDGLVGFSQNKALALCKRLVAVHSLYGVDKNPLAVELAKLSLWLESQSEGFPLTFLDHRLVIGDSITGPFFQHLLTFPSTRETLDDIFYRGLQNKLPEKLNEALAQINELEKSVGVDLADIHNKQNANAKLIKALFPFKILAAAWIGGVMLGSPECDDSAYAEIAKSISETGQLPDAAVMSKAYKMVVKGLSLADETTVAVLSDQSLMGKAVPALSYDLTFPEVFFEVTKDGIVPSGFDAVVGNPPWDKLLPSGKEFFASYDFSFVSARTEKERSIIEKKLLSNPVIKMSYDNYINSFRYTKNTIEVLYSYQVAEVDGESTIGTQDAFRLFAERSYNLLQLSGAVGMVLPSAFHANEGATGVRRLFLSKFKLEKCYSFENKKKLFDIHSSFKFAVITARKDDAGTTDFNAAFYLHDDGLLFSEGKSLMPLQYSREFIRQTSPSYLSFLELKSDADFKVASTCYSNGRSFSSTCRELNIRLSRELHMTDDAYRISLAESVLGETEDPRDGRLAGKLLVDGYYVLHEGKTFWHYTDQWESRPRYLVSIAKIADKPEWIEASRYYRLAYRAIASSTNERTSVFHLLPPGSVTGNSAPIDRTPSSHPTINSLVLMAIANTFVFDWALRLRTGANVNLFILNANPIPDFSEIRAFLGHSSLRLVCNHSGYGLLWHEQVGDNWREKKDLLAWPVLDTESARWEIRSAIDAVVAVAYHINRSQYEHILQSFDRSSGPNPYTNICLEKYDELAKNGQTAFVKKHDPYWDVPLFEELSKPVINPPKVGEAAGTDLFGKTIVAAKKKGKKK